MKFISDSGKRQCVSGFPAIAARSAAAMLRWLAGRSGVSYSSALVWAGGRSANSANCNGRGNYAVMKSCKDSQNNVHKSNRWIMMNKYSGLEWKWCPIVDSWWSENNVVIGRIEPVASCDLRQMGWRTSKVRENSF